MSEDKKYVEHCKGVNGLDKVILREVRGHSAEVYLYGGQVTSWKNEHREELLFVSSKAIFKPPKAIRGGIPLCFPQFGIGALERHGFARNRFWSIDNDPPPFPTNTSNKAFIDLILKHSEEDAKIWPHSEVRVEGLETLDYLDNLKDRERFTEQGDAITFESEVDKLYLSTPTKIAVLDHERKRTFVLRKDGLPDADTWKGYRVIRFKFHFLSFNCWCKEDLQSIILNIPCSVEYGPIITMTPMSHSCCFKVTLCLRFAPYITNVSVWSTMAAEHELLEYVR
ncbi:putative glucose-6-phosphate 1-epimerase isoform X3 [Manihot esculenta]|uniref:putative glucose-6-phosphate 1-epimerase isoform X3 n=1 Tax=Manihot esculenta TaxID=3983 RepID=UPI001CC7F0FC|nr:putative glucose-6-phosphate 1-epimerase isoform X3 [Manihot esculenta]